MMPAWATSRRLRRRLLGTAIPLALYVICRAILAASPSGLITPDGSIDVTVAVVGATAIALRLWALFILPALVVYWAIVALLERRRD